MTEPIVSAVIDQGLVEDVFSPGDVVRIKNASYQGVLIVNEYFTEPEGEPDYKTKYRDETVFNSRLKVEVLYIDQNGAISTIRVCSDLLNKIGELG